MRRHEGVFDGRHKLIRFYGRDVPNGEEWELYDLESDPSEMKSVYADAGKSDVVKSLEAELARLKEYYKVPDDRGRPIGNNKKK